MSPADREKDRNIRLDLEYDGTDFNGWAKQPGQATVEGTLEQVLGRILQQPVRLTVAGRTDTGVHARGQVVNFSTASDMETRRLQWSANQLLPDSIAISRAAEASGDFDARRSAVARTYSYSVLQRHWPSAFRHRFVHYVNGGLDYAMLERVAELIRGRHDFTAFTPTVSEHSYFEREITRSRWERDGDLLVYWISSRGFLRGMVRALVGTMLEIGRGYRQPHDLEVLLRGAERAQAGETAPAAGLCLEIVEYQLVGE